MKAKRLTAALLALAFLFGTALPVFAAAGTGAAPAENGDSEVDSTNALSYIRLNVTGDLVYGSDYTLTVEASPEDVQYIGVVIGVSGEAKGYVTLALSDKIRTLLKLIPLPRKMSKTPEQAEEFNVYSYLKQLIDGNDVSILLRVADEVVAVMDALHFYYPAVDAVSTGMKSALKMIRQFLPETDGTRIYLDEQPKDSGAYVGGAVSLQSEDINTASIAMFRIKKKSEGVRMYWKSDVQAPMTAQQAQQADLSALIEDNGNVVENGKVTYTYKKKGSLFGTSESSIPTSPGTYIQTASCEGNYSCSSITREIVIK